jgi:hypothetical protein
VNELLIMSVNGQSMTGRQSLIIRMLILSGPGDLFDGIVVIMHCTSSCACDGSELEQFRIEEFRFPILGLQLS